MTGRAGDKGGALQPTAIVPSRQKPRPVLVIQVLRTSKAKSRMWEFLEALLT